MQLKLDINDAPLVRGFKDFNTANRNAVRDTLNIAVAITRRNAIQNVKSEFNLRNNFTVREIRFDKADQAEIEQMEAHVGATERAYYLETQEEGGIRRHGKGGSKTGKTSIGMKAVRIGKSSARAVDTGFYIRKINRKVVKGGKRSLSNKTLRMPKKARAVAKMFVAERHNLYINRGFNIFKVRSFSKSGRNNVNIKLEHLYTVHQPTIHIKEHKWLEPATKKPARDLPHIYKSQLKKQWKTGPEKL